MANTKSAKKAAKQNEKKRVVNLARSTAIKTAMKKTLLAVSNKACDQAEELLKDVAAKLSRAKTKGLLHRNTAARKLSGLAKRVAKCSAESKEEAAK